MDVRRGAYGLRLQGANADPRDLTDAPTTWPDLAVTVRVDPAVGDPARTLSSEAATLPYRGGGAAQLDRAARTAELVVPRDLGPDAVVHPCLSPVAAVFARWDGREALHAGAVVGRDGAWAIVAPRGGGKSTTLAGLALRGLPLVADDLLVVHERSVFAGPPFVDLRPDAAATLGALDLARTARDGTRLRLPVIGAPPAVELCGILHLEWAAEAAVTALGVAERARLLAVGRASGLEDAAPQRALDLFGLPAWRVGRPRDGAPWATVDQLAQLIA